MSAHLLSMLRHRGGALPRAQRLVDQFARMAAGSVADLSRAQRRATVLYMSYEGHVEKPDRPPESYREFLLRTSGPLLHEPSARSRLRGRTLG